MYVCLYVCMFQRNSGTPGAIPTKLSAHVTICIYNNLIYIISIYIEIKNGCVCVCVCVCVYVPA
jgi:hypothetical protein